MTNTKLTWEQEIDEMADYKQGIYFDKTFLKSFIKKVEQEAYERGQNDNAKLNEFMYGTGFIDKEYYKP